MKHLGDFDTSTVVYGKFTTYRPSTGAPFTLAGTPALSVYKDNSTTQSTTGVTLTVDFDSVTGLHHFAIDTSADGTFYAAGSFFDIVVTTGTVDSVSAVGTVVASFTIRKNSALKPATAGRTLVVDAAGLADANTVKLGPSGSGTAQTARDIGASVLLSSGTGTGQLDFTSGVVKANATQWVGGTIPAVNVTGVPLVDAKYLLGTVFSTPTVAGIPNVNCKTWNDLATVALPLVPTTAGRTLDVSAGGEAGVDWANVGSPTTAVGLSGTTISTSQAVASVSGAVGSVTGAVGSVTGAVGSVTGAVGSVTARVTANTDQLAGQTVTAAAGVTFPSSVASPTNITAGTITTATNVTNAVTLTSAYDFAKGTVAMTEAYAADGATATPAQMLYMLWSLMAEKSISSTTLTAKKLDGSTTAMTFTLDSATTPTSITRAS